MIGKARPKRWRKALALAPEDPALLMEAGNLAAVRGDLMQGQEFHRRAVAVDPVNALARAFLASNSAALGHYAEARKEYERVIELNPSAPNSYASVGLSYLSEGKPEEAVAAAQKDAAEWAKTPHGELRSLESKASRRIRCGIEELIAKYGETGAYQIAEVYGYRNDRDHAFEWLERARQQRDAGLPVLRTDLLLKNLHSDPRWNALLQTVGLTDDQLKTSEH